LDHRAEEGELRAEELAGCEQQTTEVLLEFLPQVNYGNNHIWEFRKIRVQLLFINIYSCLENLRMSPWSPRPTRIPYSVFPSRDMTGERQSMFSKYSLVSAEFGWMKLSEVH
jgi:hypothetical protein